MQNQTHFLFLTTLEVTPPTELPEVPGTGYTSNVGQQGALLHMIPGPWADGRRHHFLVAACGKQVASEDAMKREERPGESHGGCDSQA